MIIDRDYVYSYINYTQEDAYFDSFIDNLIASMQEELEQKLNYKIEAHDNVYMCKIKGLTNTFYLPEKRVNSVTSVEVGYDTDNLAVTTDYYRVNNTFDIMLYPNQYCKITYNAGYTAEAVPVGLKLLLCKLVVFAVNESGYSNSNELGLTSKSVNANGQTFTISVSKADFMNDIDNDIQRYKLIERNNYLQVWRNGE